MRQHAFRSLLAGIALTVLLAACSQTAASTPTPSTELSGSLTVLEWSGFEIREMWADFADAYPEVPVEFIFGASDEDILAQTQQVSGADVIHIYTPFLKFYVDQGLLQEIDTSRLENWDEIPPNFQDLCTIDGKVYCVPWDWGLTSVVYRTDKITEPVTSWDVLLDEAYAGHIAMWDSGYGAYEVGSYVLGYDISNLTDAQFEEIRQLWLAQRELDPLYWIAETDMVQGVSGGDVWVAYSWNGGYRALLDAGVPVAFAEPEEGRSAYVGLYAITQESENVNLALRFIDLKLAEQSATNVMTLYGYGHVSPQYYDTVTDQTLIETLALNNPDAIEQLNFNRGFDYATFQRFIEVWEEVRAKP